MPIHIHVTTVCAVGDDEGGVGSKNENCESGTRAVTANTSSFDQLQNNESL